MEARIAALWTIGLLLAIGKAEAADPVKVATFKDGVELKIIGVSVGERRTDEPATVARKLPPGLQEFAAYGDEHLKVEAEQKDDVVRCHAISNPPTAMLLEVSLAPRPGGTGPLTFHLEDGWVAQIPYSEEQGKDFRPKSNSIEDLRAAMAATGLQLLIQHHDPDSGWIHLEGPFPYNLVSHDTSVCLLRAWRRDLTTLEFRAIRDDGEVTEFSLPNPDFHKSAAQIIPDVLPKIHNGGDYQLRILGIQRKPSDFGYHPFFGVEMELIYNGKEVSYTSDDPVKLGLEGMQEGLLAEDEWGNRVNLTGDVMRKVPYPGVCLPVNSKRLTLRLPVKRTNTWPRKAATSLIILKGTVGKDGVHVHFDLGRDADKFGIQKFATGQIRALAPAEANPARAGWKTMECTFSGKGITSDLLPALAKAGTDLEDLRCFVFPENGKRSAGIPNFSSFSGTGTDEAEYSFDHTFRWLAPSGMLKPGAKVRIGLGGPLKIDHVTFNLELPAAELPK